MHQLDIFADSRDRALLNNLADALVQGDRAAAHTAITTLRSEFPDDRHLGPATLLIDALDGEAKRWPVIRQWPTPPQRSRPATLSTRCCTMRPARCWAVKPPHTGSPFAG